MNNKGFAVTTVLYTLLIAFLMFLGAALAMFASSSSLIGKANDDLINGTNFEVTQVKPAGSFVCIGTSVSKTAANQKFWYETDTIVRVKSRYGTKYWPKDFAGASVTNEAGVGSINVGAPSGNISVSFNTVLVSGINRWKLIFTDTNTDPREEKEIVLYDVCE